MVTATPVGLGLRAMRGGAVAVGVAVDAGRPQVVHSSFLSTGAPDDRLAYEPYHVAAELPRSPDGRVTADAAAAVAEGRRRQDEAATAGLLRLRADLAEAGFQAAVLALLVNRAGWVTDLLEYSLAYADHPPVAEGLAVREALRAAMTPDLAFVEVDEKSLTERAAAVLGREPAALDAELTALGRTAGRPWRKEQKAACLAAWLTLVTG